MRCTSLIHLLGERSDMAKCTCSNCRQSVADHNLMVHVVDTMKEFDSRILQLRCWCAAESTPEPPRRLSEKNPLNLKSEVLSSHLGQGLLTLCFPDKERDNRRDGGRDRGVKIASRSHLPHHLAHFLEVTLCKGYCCMSSVVAKEHLNAVYWPTVYLLHASLFLYF